jgi:heat shock protein HtpX
MQTGKRILLFVITNLLVVTTLTILLSVLSVIFGWHLNPSSYLGLIILASLFGFGGAFISLLLSKTMAKWSMHLTIIEPNTQDPSERWLLETVYRIARQAGLEKMPEVSFYQSADPNAFATGPGKDSALVAVSTGLMENMDKASVEGVLAHELSHVTNGDMVTMTLIQGVINTFVMVISWILAQVISNALRSKDDRGGGFGGGFMQIMLVQIIQIPLSLLGMMVTMAFSRWREFHADAGSARLVGREKMISALESLKELSERRLKIPADQMPSQALQAFMIAGRGTSLFASHPALEDRIEALRQSKYQA